MFLLPILLHVYCCVGPFKMRLVSAVRQLFMQTFAAGRPEVGIVRLLAPFRLEKVGYPVNQTSIQGIANSVD
ncbi:hypothetical protein EFT87_08440 [Schleiferilactobacillus harbinensis]|nr:hypothetical protein [Schleiferilactobacillus harbinensis]